MVKFKKTLFLLVSVLCSFCIYAQSIDYTDIIEAESNWLSELQTPLGAIMLSDSRRGTINDSTKVKIEPYFSNIAMQGLLENPVPKYLEVVKKWIGWYISHLNTAETDYNGLPGTVYVYKVYAKNPAREVSAREYDSTDSYAGTFISLIKKYAERGGDMDYIRSLEPVIKVIADVMIATQDTDGLTWAKPDYKIKYLMDNCEVYDGLISYVWLLEHVFSDKSQLSFYKDRAEHCLNGIEARLWNAANQSYNWHLKGESRWEKLYPETMAQAFPIHFDLISPAAQRAKNLYKKVCETYAGLQADGLWTLHTNVSVKMGDYERANTYIKEIGNVYTNTRKWPWRASEAGSLLITASNMRKNLNRAFSAVITASNTGNAGLNRINDGRLDSTFILSGDPWGKKWITLDLQDEKNISELKLAFSSVVADKDMTVLVSKDNITYKLVPLKQCVNNPARYVIGRAVSARFVKCSFTNAAPVAVKEVEIY
jgi:hypothetical protein